MGGGHLRKCLQGKSLTEKVTFEKTLGGTEGVNQAVFQGRTIHARATASAKALWQVCVWHDQCKYKEARVREVYRAREASQRDRGG